MQIEKLTPHIGARISGLDLAALGPQDRNLICDLLEQHLVLFFIGQSLDVRAYKRFGQIIGEFERTPSVPHLSGEFDDVDIIEVPKGLVRGSYTDQWHTDVYASGLPPYATILRPEYLPSVGGDTIWADLYAAYELMSPPLQRLADELQVEVVRGSGSFIHPVVRVHPRSGRRALNVNSLFSRRIVDVSSTESGKLIDMFRTLAILPDVQVRYRWTLDTIAMWDNGFTQHYAVADYAEPRRMQRITIVGEPILGVRDYKPLYERRPIGRVL
jgi:taurine dioxygenase